MAKSKKTSSSSSQIGGAASRGSNDRHKAPAANHNNNNDDDVSLQEQLDRALVAVTTNYEQTMRLHEAWRSQISRISLLVLLVIMNQVKEPGSACMTSVHGWNTKMKLYRNSEDVISKTRAMALVTNDSVMEGMSFFCSLCIVWWIVTMPVERIRRDREFTALPFRVATALWPMIVVAYTRQPVMGCLRHLEDPYPDDAPAPARGDGAETWRAFPVVLIFYAVTTLSMFAMKRQRNSGEDQIRKVQKLRKDLMEPKKKK
jgi:hypothetical protein